MSAVSSRLEEISSSLPPSQKSTSSLSPSDKYDPALTRMQDCVERINQLMRQVRRHFNSEPAQHMQECDCCLKAHHVPVPTFDILKESDELFTNQFRELAKRLTAKEHYQQALQAYRMMTLYTNRSEDYAAIPPCYEAAGQPYGATLARLYLSTYQLKEGQPQKALTTFEHALRTAPAPLIVDALLTGFRLTENGSEGQVAAAMTIAAKQSNREDAIYIYKQVIAAKPDYLEAYNALCLLLRDPLERNYLFSKAANYATEKQEHALAARFRKAAEIPIYPPALTQEDWANPDAFLAKLPPMSEELVAFLGAPCPIYGHLGRKASDTHIVVPLMKKISFLIDGVVVTKLRTVKTLDQLDKSTGGTGCNNMSLYNVEEPVDVEFEWGVLTKEYLPGSVGEYYNPQEQLASKMGYQVPDMVDVVYCFLWEKRRSGKRLLYRKNQPAEFTRCKAWGCHVMFVGDFRREGLSALYFPDREFTSPYGILGIRKF